MSPVVISTKKLSKSQRVAESNMSAELAQRTCFADLPLHARLLLAVPRVRGHKMKATLVERYVLDTLGRIIDPGPRRSESIESVNLLAEVLLTRHQLEQENEAVDRKWLSGLENLVLCSLCKIREGQSDAAARLTSHWLNKDSVESFNAAASTLCNLECFKRGGPHVFSPGCADKVVQDAHTKYGSVSSTEDLTLGELLLLNALRLRMRTLPHTRFASQVVPMFRENLALPRIETLLDALLAESLLYGSEAPDIRCLCSRIISVGESCFLSAISVFATADAELIASQLRTWLPLQSAERLQARTKEFQSIIKNLGSVVPRRDWNTDQLSHSSERQYCCEHLNEPSMIH